MNIINLIINNKSTFLLLFKTKALNYLLIISKIIYIFYLIFKK